MKISSTEFQQNVGYYLDLAERGEEITIEKKKPFKSLYTIKKKKKYKIGEPRVLNDQSFQKIMKSIKKNKYISKNYKSGLELQDQVRS